MEHELDVAKDNGEDTDGTSVAQDEKFEELAAQYEELKAQVERHFDDGKYTIYLSVDEMISY